MAIFLLLAAGSIWASRHTAFEYDFLELEPEGLKSVDLEREIPGRFGVSNQTAWAICESVEECRGLKEALRKKAVVGDVSAISDFVPPAERLEAYTPRLAEFRRNLEESPHAGIAMLGYWWLCPVLVPVVAVDMLLRATPFCLGAWPIGFEYLGKDY